MTTVAPAGGRSPLARSPVGTSQEEYDERLRAIREEMVRRQLDAMLVVSPENVFYLLGLNYQGYFAFTLLVLPVTGLPRLLTRAVERPTVAAQVPGTAHITFDDDDDLGDAAVRAISAVCRAGDRVGVERAAMFFPLGVWDGIRERLDDVRWTDASGVIEQVRAVKSPSEIELIRRAARISDKAIRAGIDAAGPGVSEREVAAHVYHKMISAGSEDPGFAPFIRAGDALAQEHVTWRNRPLDDGESLFLELSASVNRYHAPLSRLVHAGSLPSDVDRVAAVALAGMDAAAGALRPGAVAGEVYGAWQRAIDAGLGHRRYVRHHCGYLVGIGFPPSWVGGSAVVGLRRGGEMVIREGMVFHVQSWIIGVEPADYLISDTALVMADGCELLTHTPREPTAVS